MISSSGKLILKLETKSNIINHKELQQVDGITQRIKCKCNNLSKRGMTENFKKMFNWNLFNDRFTGENDRVNVFKFFNKNKLNDAAITEAHHLTR